MHTAALQMPQASPERVADIKAMALTRPDYVMLRTGAPVDVMAAARELGYHGAPFGLTGYTIKVRRA